jgi:hypothetical protein
MSSDRNLLRHALATLAYRGGKTIQDAPANFAEYGGPDSTRTAGQILGHMGDLMDWALSMAEGNQRWHDSALLAWEKEGQRFFSAVKKFDDYLASEKELKAPIEKLFQGPVADALTHVGQLAMLRRMAASPIRGENYYVAEITIGRVGEDQAPPRKPFS